MEDEAIRALFWARDEAAIQESDAKYGRMLHGIAYNILHSREDSEETVSDTYQRAWDTIPPQAPHSLGAYLGRITRNLSINRWHAARAGKRAGGAVLLSELSECVPAGEDTEQAADAAALAGIINGWLAGLPEADRILFLRRYWFCDPVADLAAAAGVRPGQMSGRLYRLRQSLRRTLEQQGVTV